MASCTHRTTGRFLLMVPRRLIPALTSEPSTVANRSSFVRTIAPNPEDRTLHTYLATAPLICRHEHDGYVEDAVAVLDES